MPRSKESRLRDMQRMKQLLNTQDGKVLLDELGDLYDPFSLMGNSPEATAYAVGQRDVYKFLREVQTGDYDG